MTRDEPGALSRLGTSTLLGALLLTGTSCATGRRVVEALTSNCHEVEAGVANEMMRDNPGILLLDVREPSEYAADQPHIRKAREIPLSELPRRYREINAWKKESILIFSRDGTDAASACEFLSRQGFPYVSHVTGESRPGEAAATAVRAAALRSRDRGVPRTSRRFCRPWRRTAISSASGARSRHGWRSRRSRIVP